MSDPWKKDQMRSFLKAKGRILCRPESSVLKTEAGSGKVGASENSSWLLAMENLLVGSPGLDPPTIQNPTTCSGGSSVPFYR